MAILQFGKTGQLARALQSQAEGKGVDLRALSRHDVDITDASAVERAIFEARGIDLVINATAFSLVDKAEGEPEEAFAVNATAPGIMARACAGRGVPFVHVSTDCVFDGSGSAPRREDDPALPINAYGRSKRAGEEAVLAAGGTSLIVRTSWVFSEFGSNFVQIMLGVADRPLIKVVDDQFACPTPARALADFLLSLEGRLDGPDAARLRGVVHYVGDEPVNRFAFAQAVFAAAGLSPATTPVPSSDFPTPAERPKNGVLDTTRLRTVYGVEPPRWREALGPVVAKVTGKGKTA
jgi:dTDP-4-dehydrorhamnose reductase